jgi:hypothetical protein
MRDARLTRVWRLFGGESPTLAALVAAVVGVLVVLLVAAYVPLFLLVASVQPRVFGFPGADCVTALAFAAMGFLIAPRYPARSYRRSTAPTGLCPCCTRASCSAP